MMAFVRETASRARARRNLGNEVVAESLHLTTQCHRLICDVNLSPETTQTLSVRNNRDHDKLDTSCDRCTRLLSRQRTYPATNEPPTLRTSYLTVLGEADIATAP